ncbi:MAG: hypothetical protein QOF60_1976 [Actinomycetota bacterium]|jgi:tetratricopeptide (TPR) repeat protein|nr:hypothetical protein [Actinomycetota bacterium]
MEAADAHRSAGLELWQLGRIDDALEAFSAARSAYDEAGHDAVAAELDREVGERLIEDGRADDAIPWLVRALATFDDLDQADSSAKTHRSLAEAFRQLDRKYEAALHDAAADGLEP